MTSRVGYKGTYQVSSSPFDELECTKSRPTPI